MYWLKVSDRKSQTEKSISKEEGHWNWKLRMEKFSNNGVTKKNSIAKISQFSVWGRSHIFPLIIFFPDFSLTFKVIFSFPWRFKTTTTKKNNPFSRFPLITVNNERKSFKNDEKRFLFYLWSSFLLFISPQVTILKNKQQINKMKYTIMVQYWSFSRRR